MTDLTDEAVKALLAHYDLPTDCDCDGDDCVKCSHYPTFQERASRQLKDAAPDLARALLASEAARKLAEERLAKSVVAREKIKAAYEELLATVHGECPSLINEDSGGSQVLLDLILAADEAITTIKELNE